MAIEFWIEHGCSVKERLTVQGFKEKLKQRFVALGMVERAVHSGQTRRQALDEIYRFGTLGPDGPGPVREVSIRVLLDETKILEVLADHCTGCPANLCDRFGCYNVINYPISARAENWLADMARKSGERTDTANIPIRVILDKKLKGEPFTRMRRLLGERSFELGKSPLITFEKGPFKRRSIWTDQLLDVLFLNREIKGSFLQVLAQFSGGLVIQDREPHEGDFEMAFALEDSKGRQRWLVFNLHDEEGDDQTTLQLKLFFHAVFRAAELDETISVDV